MDDSYIVSRFAPDVRAAEDGSNVSDCSSGDNIIDIGHRMTLSPYAEKKMVLLKLVLIVYLILHANNSYAFWTKA